MTPSPEENNLIQKTITFPQVITQISSLLAVILVLSLVGFSYSFQIVLFSTIYFFSLSYIAELKIGISDFPPLVQLISTQSISLISALAFSESEFIRGFDTSMLLLTLSCIFIHSATIDRKNTLSLNYAYFFSITNSAYSLIIENYRSPGFLSLINKSQIIIAIILIIFLIIPSVRKNFDQKNIFRDSIIGIGVGSLLVLLKSEKTDFPWDSIIWAILIWTFSACLFYWIITNKKEDTMIFGRNFTHTELIILSLLVASFFLLPGIFDHQETRKHVVYHLGLFTLLSENAVENGLFQRCTDIELPTSSSGIETGEPGGCWVYPAGWWSPPVWILSPFILLGFDGIHASRFLSFSLRAISAILISLIVKNYSNRPAAPFFSIIAFLTCTQVTHYGRIYTWQQFEDIFILIAIILWIPLIKESAKPSTKLIFRAVSFSSIGPIILGFGASAVSCYLASAFLFLSRCNIRLRATIFSIILASSIMSWVIWDNALQYYYQNPNAAEDLIFWKINYRSSEGQLLLSSEYYLELMAQSAYLMGPLLCMGFISLFPKLKYLFSERNVFSQNMIIVTTFSPFIFLWLANSILFPQMGFSHDYLAFWTLVPALSAIIGDFVAGIDRTVATASLISVLMVSSKELVFYENTIHDPDMIPIHHWARDNIEENHSVLLSHDLYKEHYIAAISGQEIFHYYQSTDGELVRSDISNLEIDVILTNSTGMENWKLIELTNQGWCVENFVGSEFTYYALKKCI